jgi:hypothetical protein
MPADILDHTLAASLDSLPGNLRQRVYDEFRTGQHMELVNGSVNQKRIAAGTRSVDRKSIDGVGRLRMRIDPSLYHYWGKTLGYECWKDSQFLREVERDNPETRVACGGTKLQVGYASPRFKKSYAL